MLTENNHKRKQLLKIRLMFAGGAIGPLLFTAVYLIEGVTRPGYDPWLQAASALSLGDGGWMQITNFLVFGLLTLGFAIAVRQTVRGGYGSTWGPRLLIAVALAFLVAGVFATDAAQGYPPGTPMGPSVSLSFHGIIHWVLGGLVVFFGIPASCYVFARRWITAGGWKRWLAAIGTALAGFAMLACFVTFATQALHHGPAGLFERLSLSAGLLWLSAFSFVALLNTRSATFVIYSKKEEKDTASEERTTELVKS